MVGPLLNTNGASQRIAPLPPPERGAADALPLPGPLRLPAIRPPAAQVLQAHLMDRGLETPHDRFGARYVRLAQRRADALCGALDGAGAVRRRQPIRARHSGAHNGSGNNQAGASSSARLAIVPRSETCHAGPSASLRCLRLMASPEWHRPDRLLFQRLLRIFLPALRLPPVTSPWPKLQRAGEIDQSRVGQAYRPIRCPSLTRAVSSACRNSGPRALMPIGCSCTRCRKCTSG